MKRLFSHIRDHSSKYIIGILLGLVFALAFVICGNKDNRFEKLCGSVLMLNIYDIENELVATGSGFVVFENDILVTNYHVIEQAFKIEAVDEKDVVYSLDKVIAFDKDKDLAILKFSVPTNLKDLKLYDSSKISKGDEIIAIGSPLGLKNTVSEGIISSIRGDNFTDVIQFTAPISSGSSGGALLNKRGKVVGVTFAGIEDGQNINLAIPSNEILNLYKNKSNEISIQHFLFEQNPTEKYKLECVKASFDEIYNKPGKFHRYDISLKGYISSLSSDESYGYIVENYDNITNNLEHDRMKSLYNAGRIIGFSNKDKFGNFINENLRVGDFVAVYGILIDTKGGLAGYLNSRNGTNNRDRYVDEPKVIENI